MKDSAPYLESENNNNAVQLPKLPFGAINFYQNLIPLSFVVGFDLLWLFGVTKLAIPTWIQVCVLPLIFIFDYLLYIWSISKSGKLLRIIFDKKSPPKQGTFARTFSNGNVSDISLHYYHLRGFLYKWPVWIAKKSIFPWSVTYVLRDMADNKISRDFMYGDVYVGLEMTNLNKGAVIMDGGIISSHVVDSLYGNLTIKECTLDNYSIMLPNSVITPGVRIKNEMSLGPNAFVPKSWIITNEHYNFIYGVPSKQLGYPSFFSRLPEEYLQNWEIKKESLNI